MIATTRLGLQYPQGPDDPNVYPAVAAVTAGILDNAILYSSGTLVSRPAAAIAGRIYLATDTGLYYLDTGTAWNTIMVAGAWLPLTLATGVIATTSYTPSIRLEGDLVRLKGALGRSTGTSAAGATLATIPSAARISPGMTFYVSQFGQPSPSIFIDPSGPISSSQALGVGSPIQLDGISYTRS